MSTATARNAPSPNINAVVRRDPTYTLTLRRAYEAQMYKRFRWLKGVIRDAIIQWDVFGLREGVFYQDTPPQFDPDNPAFQRRQFDFPTNEEKISAFMA